MSTDMPAALASEVAETAAAESRITSPQWIETALTVMFAAAAVLLVSFIAVLTSLS